MIACVRKPIDKLKFEQPGGAIEVPLRALTDPAQAEPADWVLLCTKTYQTEAAAPWLARLCTPATRVAVLQNGIDHVARVAPLANGATVDPGDRLLQRRAAGARSRAAAARSQQRLRGGERCGGHAFAQLFAGTPLRVQLGDDFVTIAWRKLLINAIASPITALTLQRQAVLRRAEVKELALALLDEAIAVGRAEGATLADDEARARWRRCSRSPANSAPRCISTASPEEKSKSKH